MSPLKRKDRLTDPDGRTFIVNSVTFDRKWVLLQRLDRQLCEHITVWKDLAEVQAWRQGAGEAE